MLDPLAANVSATGGLPLCLGVRDMALQLSWEHCRNIVLRAEEAGYENLLLPSNLIAGIGSVAFAAPAPALCSAEGTGA